MKAYDEAFTKLPQLFVQKEIPESDTTRHLYILRIRPEKLTIDRKKFFEALAAENVCCNVHYIPTYYFPYYEKLGYKRGLCPKAEKSSSLLCDVRSGCNRCHSGSYQNCGILCKIGGKNYEIEHYCACL